MKISYKTKLTNARCRVMMTDPWYGVISSRITWTPNEKIKTMGVRIIHLGKVECLYSPSYVDELNIESIIAVIKHEIEHIIRMHIPRSKELKNNSHALNIWNIAADWVINGEYDDPRIKDLPSNLCYIPNSQNPGKWLQSEIMSLSSDMTSEEFFKWLYDNTEYNNGLLISKNSGNEINISFDNHDVWSTCEVSDEDMRNAAKDLVRFATSSCGKSPGHLLEDIKKLEKSEINWTHLFRGIIGRSAGGKRSTFSKRHRKRDVFGIKGYSNRSNIPLTIFVDTSASVSSRMLGKFFSEIESASQKFKITLVEFDYMVQQVKRYHKGDWNDIKIKGRGGTSFINCLNYAEENGLIGKMNIMFTDGESIIPSKKPYPFLWVIVGNNLKNINEFWGEVIYIKNDYIN